MTKAFISYSHADESILERLHVHMAVLKRENKISSWHDREILAGSHLNANIDNALNSSNLFIALVSPDYLNSTYCYDKEFAKAIEMDSQWKIIIVPIIIEPCDWKSSPFKNFKAIPRDGKPISEWTNENNAFLNVIDELRRLLDLKQSDQKPAAQNTALNKLVKNYRIQRDFTAVDKLNFRDDTFKIIKEYFTSSLDEINGLEQIQARFADNDPNSFTCVISNRSKIDSTGYITIFIPKENYSLGNGELSYSLTERPNNHLDKSFSIQENEYELTWSLKNFYNSHNSSDSLTAKQIAEKLWVEFLVQVGISY